MYRDTWGSLATSLPSNIDDKLRLIRDSAIALRGEYQVWVQGLKNTGIFNSEYSKLLSALARIIG